MVFDLTEHSVYLLIGAFFVWVVGDIINKLRKKQKVDWKQLLLAIILGFMAYNMYLASLTS